jgi:predicted permease
MRDAFRQDLAAARARGRTAAIWFWLLTAVQVLRFGLSARAPFAGLVSGRASTFDWRDAYRSLRATPVVTAVAIASLALGIGANTALFSILNSLTLKRLPVRDPAGLVMLDSEYTNPIWEQIRGQQHEWFDGALAWSSQRFNLSSQGETDPIDGAYAGGGFFDVLGVHALIGRTFTEADDIRRGGPDGPVVVISYGFWQRRFGGAGDVLGRSLQVDRVPLTIVGVMPREFLGPEVGRTMDVIVPLGVEPLIRGRASALDERLNWWLSVMARLKPNQTLEAAASALNTARPAIRDATIPTKGPGAGDQQYLGDAFVFVSASTGDSPLRTRYQQPLTIILAVVGAVLLIACANIANLLLARAAARRRELSLRMALGASRARLARQLLAESLLLSGAGAGFGLALAIWGSGLLVRAIATPAAPASMDLSIDWRVLAFTAGAAIAAAILFGLAPALGMAHVSPHEALKDQGRGVVGDRHAMARNGLVVVQVALSLGLVVVAGLFARTFTALTAVPLGFDSQSLVTARLDLKQSAVDEAHRGELFDRLRAAAGTVPGVESASVSIITPVSGSGWNTLIEKPALPGASKPQLMAWVNGITPEWFETYRMRMLAGRAFTSQDREGSPLVLIANQAFAQRFFAGTNPIGKEVRTALAATAGNYQIVGVVNDAVYRSQRAGVTPTLYLPLAQSEHRPAGVALTVRTAAGLSPAVVNRGVTEAIVRVDPRVTLTFTLLDDQVRASVARERLVAWLAAFFGGLALLLAGLGLYGVTSYSVGRRRSEIGIRMALGAGAGGVVRLVLRRLAWLIGAGVVLGAVLSLWASTSMTTLLFGVTARDPLTFVVAAVALTIAGGVAGWLPARRAARIDPLQALRDQ